MNTEAILPSSFRDPSGFLFSHNNKVYRQINSSYQENYEYLIDSGLYSELEAENLLISHTEVSPPLSPAPNHYKTILPEQIDFISYPYEWCFHQLKDAALTTLEIQKISLKFGMSLKDASAYNIQFHNGRPIFIDTLSFEKFQEGRPWVAYRQFCQHFFGPLALMNFKDTRLGLLSRTFIDGVPLDLASALLPWYTYLKLPFLLHIHIHARSQKHYQDKKTPKTSGNVSTKGLTGIFDSLESAIGRMQCKMDGTEWGDYYKNTNYKDSAMAHKEELVSEFLKTIAPKPKRIWDIGANEGIFSRIAAGLGAKVVSADVDEMALQKNTITDIKLKETNILPLKIDLANPSPALGWGHKERMSFMERGPADAVLALALLHHLAITNNLPLEQVASFFQSLTHWLIIEFVPKNDSQVQRLLSSREDIFTEYSQHNFENQFRKYFRIEKQEKINSSDRTLYLMESTEN